MFDFGALANEFVIAAIHQTPEIVYRMALAAPFVGDFFGDIRSAKWVQRPFVRVWCRRFPPLQERRLYATWWELNGRLHRNEDDKPAGTRYTATGAAQWWWYNGKRHRDFGRPATVEAGEREEWWINGQRHREGDLPAMVLADGGREWWRNGKRHRTNDMPAVIIAYDGVMEWWVNGERHRSDGKPARVWISGHKEWWYNGRKHRNSFCSWRESRREAV